MKALLTRSIHILIVSALMVFSLSISSVTHARNNLEIVRIMGHHVLLSDGTVWSWSNGLKKIDIDGIKDISRAGGHFLALRDNGTLWSWGNNLFGQLGDTIDIGKNGYNETPRQVQGMTDVVAIAAGMSFSAVLKSDGTVWTWGDNSSGNLGDGQETTRYILDGVEDIDSSDRSEPQIIPGLTNVIGIWHSSNGMVALKDDQTLWGWGSWVHSPVPTEISRFTESPILKVDSYLHSFVTLENGEVWAIGLNKRGQFGNGVRTLNESPYATEPVRITQLAGFDKLALGSEHSLGLKDNVVYSWGGNLHGTLGNGLVTTQINDGTRWVNEQDHDQLSPLPVKGLTDVEHIWTDTFASFAQKKDGSVYAWGINVRGYLGTGDSEDKSVPTRVTVLDELLNYNATAENIPITPEVKTPDIKTEKIKIPVVNHTPNKFTIYLDGKQISFDQPPIEKDGRVQVPLRAIFDAIGADIVWDGPKLTVTATKGDKIIVIKAGSTEASLNGKKVNLDSPALVVNNRMLVPVRFVTETFGGTVGWDKATNIITLSVN
jgi:alpha-tubulin suppressor-like RCC1 family protein